MLVNVKLSLMVVFTVFSTLISLSANSAVYKCKTDNGQISYSNRPCANGEFKKIKISESPTKNEYESDSRDDARFSSPINCINALKNGNNWIDSMMEVGRRNFETGNMSQSEYNGGSEKLSRMRSKLNLDNCKNAKGANKKFFGCLSKITNHISKCGQRYRPSFY